MYLDTLALAYHRTGHTARAVDLYETRHAAEPGKGYDAKADEWRARLPAKEEEQADEAGRSAGD